jgi:hypothetical protein
MRKRRSSEAVVTQERRQKSTAAGGNSRPSTKYVASPEAGPARHGHIDRLSFNYGHAEGGKPRRGDLQSMRVHRRRVGDDFEPDEQASDYQRTVKLARQSTKPMPFGRDIFENDSDAKAWWVYFRARRTPIDVTAAVALASKIRRLGLDPERVSRVLRKHSDLAWCPRATALAGSRLSDGQFATALLILSAQGVLHQHPNAWPPEYKIRTPRSGVNDI